MEIFRTDGGGKSTTDARLTSLLVDFCRIAPELVKKVIEIRDHKGTLMVTVNDLQCIESLYHLFVYLWMEQCEFLVSIYFDDVCVIGYDKGDYYGR